MFQYLAAAAESKYYLPTTAIALTSGSVSIPAPTTTIDTRWYGFAPAYGGYGPIGSISPSTIDGRSITYLLEQITFASTNGTYTTITGRTITFIVAVSGVSQDSFTSLTTPGGTLLTSAATFSTGSGTSSWTWTVTTGTDDGTADYLSSGTVTVTQ